MIGLVLVFALPQTAPRDLLSPEESAGVDAVVSSLIGAGFPDTAGSEIRFGTLEVFTSYDPGAEPGPFPALVPMAQSRVPGSSRLATQYSFYGLHFRLADGTWLIELLYRYRPREGDRVDTSNGPRVDPAGLTRLAAETKPFQAQKDAASWLARVSPSQRARLAAAMDRVVPVTFRLKIDPEALAPAIVLLRRAGWPDAGAAALSVADQRARDYCQIHLWTGAVGSFDPAGAYAQSKDEEAAWRAAHPEVDLEPPQVALRRALFRWSSAQILADRAMLSPSAAVAASRATLDPQDPQHLAPWIDALEAGSKLPVAPALGEDLASRLASWEARPRRPKMKAPSDAAGATDLRSVVFETPVEGYVPKPEDLDRLFELLEDERPSRYLDVNGPRTVGDNAWRALAILLHEDPRTLAHHPADLPWTAPERKAAALAVRAWWKDHRADYVGK